jgi:hypothetical protein
MNRPNARETAEQDRAIYSTRPSRHSDLGRRVELLRHLAHFHLRCSRRGRLSTRAMGADWFAASDSQRISTNLACASWFDIGSGLCIKAQRLAVIGAGRARFWICSWPSLPAFAIAKACGLSGYTSPTRAESLRPAFASRRRHHFSGRAVGITGDLSRRSLGGEWSSYRCSVGSCATAEWRR